MSNRVALTENDSQFLIMLGAFFASWSATEFCIDLGIGRLLSLSADETHMITAGLELNRKASILRMIVERKGHPRKAEIKAAIDYIQNRSDRNIIAHGFLGSVEGKVAFTKREGHGGRFSAKLRTFTVAEFTQHVEKFSDHAIALQAALGIEDEELDAFAKAADDLSS